MMQGYIVSATRLKSREGSCRTSTAAVPIGHLRQCRRWVPKWLLFEGFANLLVRGFPSNHAEREFEPFGCGHFGPKMSATRSRCSEHLRTVDLKCFTAPSMPRIKSYLRSLSVYHSHHVCLSRLCWGINQSPTPLCREGSS